MKTQMLRWIIAGWFFPLAAGQPPGAQETEIGFELTRVDSGEA